MTGTPPRRVFVGISGASGAPYAVRLVQSLAAAGCELQLSISDAGILVLQHELSIPAGHRAAVTGAFLERASASAQTYAPDDLAAPPASGSSFPDAAVICPCSVGTAAHIALGTTRTLIHRVGDVALKERRPLVLVPRETPLTQIHLRRLLELAEAGAIVLPAMPGFYTRPKTLQDAVDHVVGKVISALGFEQTLFPPWDGGRR
jgi:4-hydroxy-3-polyprenylbenzoate decarboxylase